MGYEVYHNDKHVTGERRYSVWHTISQGFGLKDASLFQTQRYLESLGVARENVMKFITSSQPIETFGQGAVVITEAMWKKWAKEGKAEIIELKPVSSKKQPDDQPKRPRVATKAPVVCGVGGYRCDAESVKQAKQKALTSEQRARAQERLSKKKDALKKLQQQIEKLENRLEKKEKMK